MFQQKLPARALLTGAFFAALSMAPLRAQVSAYSFTQQVGTWQPINGGTLMGYQLIDDEVFVDPDDLIGFMNTSMGPGFPIGFTFHYNGIPFDRVGISTEGWIALGQSAGGDHAVHVPIGGDAAYSPLATPPMAGLDPLLHHRIVAFGNDMRAQAGGPMRIQTSGTAPNRTLVVQWNGITSTSFGGSFMFQVRLAEGGGVPSAQTVQVVYGAMSIPAGSMTVQVGLGGADVNDFNIRSVPTAPFDWTVSAAGVANTATCGFSGAGTTLPQGLIYTWTPPSCTVFGVAVTDLVPLGATANATLSWLPLAGATSYDYVVTQGGPTDPPIASANGVTGTTAALTGLPAQADLFAYVRATCGGTPGPWGAGFAFNARSEVLITCGAPPVVLDLCYNSLEHHHWHYTSSDGSPMRILFNAGYIGSGDVLRIFDGADNTAAVLYTSPPGGIDLTGQQISSNGDELYMELTTDDLGSC
ncbi:MAG TPA: hypothetical protein VHL57_12595, partial [Flavobacteriales bacterium]|nr:hypothetical protein [Flavobacteriales bacterium]